MEHTQKLVMDPLEPKTNKIKDNAVERFTKIIKIILKLAKIDGYDQDGRIRGPDGAFVKNSDLGTLINYTLRNDKALTGMDEFVAILYKADIDPDVIVNANIKAKLFALRSHKPEPTEPQAEIYAPAPAAKRKLDIIDDEPVSNYAKRRRHDDDSSENYKSLKRDWEASDSE